MARIRKIQRTGQKLKRKAPRVTIAIEPAVAERFRDLAKQEGMQLSQLLEQSLIAWLRRWRPEYQLEVEGPEGPPERTRIIAVGDAMSFEDSGRPVGIARRISAHDVESYGTAVPNPGRRKGKS
jgi:hypothetical protein